MLSLWLNGHGLPNPDSARRFGNVYQTRPVRFGSAGDVSAAKHPPRKIIVRHEASPPVEALGAIGLPDGVAAVRDDRQSAFVPDLLAHLFAVVGLVGALTAGLAAKILRQF
jgi:hypothetical protein